MTPHRTGVRFPASPRSPNRPLSRMGCGGDYRFQSRGRTAVGFYHPAGRPTASPAGYFYAQFSVCSGVYRRARGCSGDRIVSGLGVKRFGLTSKVWAGVERFRWTTSSSAPTPPGTSNPTKKNPPRRSTAWWPLSWASTSRLDAAVDPPLRVCMTEEAYFSCNVNLRVTSGETL